MHAANAVDEFVELAIVESANHHAHGISHQRVIEAGEFPCAEMPGQNQNSPAQCLGGQIVLEAVGAYRAAACSLVCSGASGKTRQDASQGSDRATEGCLCGLRVSTPVEQAKDCARPRDADGPSRDRRSRPGPPQSDGPASAAAIQECAQPRPLASTQEFAASFEDKNKFRALERDLLEAGLAQNPNAKGQPIVRPPLDYRISIHFPTCLGRSNAQRLAQIRQLRPARPRSPSVHFENPAARRSRFRYRPCSAKRWCRRG